MSAQLSHCPKISRVCAECSFTQQNHVWLFWGFVTGIRQAADMPKGAELSLFLATVTVQVWLQAGQKYHLNILLSKTMQVWLSVGQRFQCLTLRCPEVRIVT